MKIVDGKYIVDKEILYYSYRYNRELTIPVGFEPNGASGIAIDIMSNSWVIHDWICTYWKWDDGTPITNFQASVILHDILLDEGRWVRARSWMIAIWLLAPIYWKIKKFLRPS